MFCFFFFSQNFFLFFCLHIMWTDVWNQCQTKTCFLIFFLRYRDTYLWKLLLKQWMKWFVGLNSLNLDQFMDMIDEFAIYAHFFSIAYIVLTEKIVKETQENHHQFKYWSFNLIMVFFFGSSFDSNFFGLWLHLFIHKKRII